MNAGVATETETRQRVWNEPRLRGWGLSHPEQIGPPTSAFRATSEVKLLFLLVPNQEYIIKTITK